MANNGVGVVVPTERIKQDGSYGYGVSSLMAAYLNRFLDWQDALAIAVEFDKQIVDADWLETFNGTTFYKPVR